LGPSITGLGVEGLARTLEQTDWTTQRGEFMFNILTGIDVKSNLRIVLVSFICLWVLLLPACGRKRLGGLDPKSYPPPGVYSFSKHFPFGLGKGFSKELVFQHLLDIQSELLQIRTRAPFHCQIRGGVGSQKSFGNPLIRTDKSGPKDRWLEFSPELRKSNYWIAYYSDGSCHLYLFSEVGLRRVIVYVRNGYDSSTSLGPFMASYPIRGYNKTLSEADSMSSLPDKELDRVLIGLNQFVHVELH